MIWLLALSIVCLVGVIALQAWYLGTFRKSANDIIANSQKAFMGQAEWLQDQAKKQLEVAFLLMRQPGVNSNQVEMAIAKALTDRVVSQSEIKPQDPPQETPIFAGMAPRRQKRPVMSNSMRDVIDRAAQNAKRAIDAHDNAGG